MSQSSLKSGLSILLVSAFLLSACQALSITPPATSTPSLNNLDPTLTPASSSTDEPTLAAVATATKMPTLPVTPSGPATCAVAPILPIVDETVDRLIPDASENDWFFGSNSPRVTIIEYTDFQCQICASLALNLRQLAVLYPEDVQVVFRYLPLTTEHDKAGLAAQAVEAAGLQDSYWEMHDLLFSKQEEWTTLSTAEFADWLVNQSEALGLDSQIFAQDLISEGVVNKVFEATQASSSTNLTNPPVLFFNKSIYQNWVDISSLMNMVEYYKLPDKAFERCPEMALDNTKTYTAVFLTQYGEIVFELFPKEAPMAVNNFIFLVNQKWYDNSTFFRVIPGFLVQGGDPSGSGNGRPGYLFTNEVTPDLRFDEPGMLAMTNYGDGTNGSQFFITYTEIPEYDGKFTIFGKVIEGMEVLNSLRPRNPETDSVLLPADVLISVTINEN